MPDRTIEMCTLPEVTEAQVRRRYPGAIDVAPLPDDPDDALRVLNR